jgi:uncharacterized protein (DUF58 family)
MDKKDLFSQVKRLHLTSTKLVDGLFAGNYRSVFKGPGIEFDEVREYTPGDDSRLIDWNVTSRMSSAYTKKFREEREIVLFLIIDVSASLLSGSGIQSKKEIVGILSAILAMSAVSNNDRAGAVFFSDKIEHWVPPMKGKKHVMRLIRDILTIEPEGRGSDLGMALRTVYESFKRRGICVVLSDFKTASGRNELTLLARKHDVIALKIVDPTDFSFPLSGLIDLRDPETGAEMRARGGGRKFARSYAEYWDDFHSDWEKSVRSSGADVLTISTDDDPVKKLIGFFDRRRER